MLKNNYKMTMFSCFAGYITQAITVNLPPLLFVMFMRDYSLPLSLVTTLITFTFVVQLLVDLVVSRILSNKNVRLLVVAAQVCAVIGLISLAILPEIINNKFVSLLISALFYSMGSGLIEVVVSPIVEACPNDNKSGAMSLLHSFYCWGSAFTIGITTLCFYLFGTGNWRWIAALWAIIPVVDAVLTAIMPIGDIEHSSDRAKSLFKKPTFYIMFILMVLGGAAELAVSQWASTFAETGLNISKSAGDLAGPFMFAILMGTGRVLFAALGDRIKLINYMLTSAILLTVGFSLAAFSPYPMLSLIGIALCGLAVAIFWPGTLSLAAERLGGSTNLFGLLAFAGDIGCTLGPMAVGAISQGFGDNISVGLGFSLIFPIGIMLTILILKNKRRT